MNRSLQNCPQYPLTEIGIIVALVVLGVGLAVGICICQKRKKNKPQASRSSDEPVDPLTSVVASRCGRRRPKRRGMYSEQSMPSLRDRHKRRKLCQLNCIRFTQLQSTHHYCGYTSHLCPHEELANGLGGSTTAPWLSVKGDPRVSGDTLGYWER